MASPNRLTTANAWLHGNLKTIFFPPEALEMTPRKWNCMTILVTCRNCRQGKKTRWNYSRHSKPSGSRSKCMHQAAQENFGDIVVFFTLPFGFLATKQWGNLPLISVICEHLELAVGCLKRLLDVWTTGKYASCFSWAHNTKYVKRSKGNKRRRVMMFYGGKEIGLGYTMPLTARSAAFI